MSTNLSNASAKHTATAAFAASATLAVSAMRANSERSESRMPVLTFSIDHIRFQLAIVQYAISFVALETLLGKRD